MKLPYIANSDSERNRIAKEVHANQRAEQIRAYKEPTTKEEWWVNVYAWWDELVLIMERFIPMKGYTDLEKLAQIKGRPTTLSITLREYIFQLKQKHDKELVNYLEATWASAPDAGWIHTIKGWNVLCDLCSEAYVLNEEPNSR